MDGSRSRHSSASRANRRGDSEALDGVFPSEGIEYELAAARVLSSLEDAQRKWGRESVAVGNQCKAVFTKVQKLCRDLANSTAASGRDAGEDAREAATTLGDAREADGTSRLSSQIRRATQTARKVAVIRQSLMQNCIAELRPLLHCFEQAADSHHRVLAEIVVQSEEFASKLELLECGRENKRQAVLVERQKRELRDKRRQQQRERDELAREKRRLQESDLLHRQREQALRSSENRLEEEKRRFRESRMADEARIAEQERQLSQREKQVALAEERLKRREQETRESNGLDFQHRRLERQFFASPHESLVHSEAATPGESESPIVLVSDDGSDVEKSTTAPASGKGSTSAAQTTTQTDALFAQRGMRLTAFCGGGFLVKVGESLQDATQRGAVFLSAAAEREAALASALQNQIGSPPAPPSSPRIEYLEVTGVVVSASTSPSPQSRGQRRSPEKEHFQATAERDASRPPLCAGPVAEERRIECERPRARGRDRDRDGDGRREAQVGLKDRERSSSADSDVACLLNSGVRPASSLFFVLFRVSCFFSPTLPVYPLVSLSGWD